VAGVVNMAVINTIKAAVRAWYESPGYQAIRHLRTDNTEGIGAIAESR
jgi:uncharacterized protein (DUF1330 family)